jgi:hypothetical protein
MTILLDHLIVPSHDLSQGNTLTLGVRYARAEPRPSVSREVATSGVDL